MVGDLSTPMRRGERIRNARRLRLLSISVLDRAVLTELADGADWDEVAFALGLEVAEARRRYAPVWDQWQAGEFEAEDFGDFGIGLTGDLDAAGTAEALDAWWQRHSEPWEQAPEGITPVTTAITGDATT
jgi:hypothetical protein